MSTELNAGEYAVAFRAKGTEEPWQTAKGDLDFASALRVANALEIKYGVVGSIAIRNKLGEVIHEPDTNAHGWICTGCLTTSEHTDDATFAHMHHCDKGGTVEPLLGTLATWGRAFGAF